MVQPNPILELSDLSKSFGSLNVFNNLSAEFYSDELCAIIGPNGAGKTTLFNLITGQLNPDNGTVVFAGSDITGVSPYKVARRGLIRSFQVTNIFSEMTVYDNVQTSVLSNQGQFNFWQRRDRMDDVHDRCLQLLEQVDLLDERDQTAANLSHGDQRMLEIVLALGKDPDLLMLDEPTSGMSSTETNEMINVVTSLAEEIPIILIEHKMTFVRRVADRLIVLHDGSILADGKPETVRQNEAVQRVYLKNTAE